MNPPLRARQDLEALVQGVVDGTIDMIATDHAPHSQEEKARGLSGSAFGIVGLETAFPLLYTHLVRKGVITLNRLMELMSHNPRERFGIKLRNDFCVWDLNEQFIVTPDKFLTKGRATPLSGMELYGVNKLTIADEKVAYKE